MTDGYDNDEKWISNKLMVLWNKSGWEYTEKKTAAEASHTHTHSEKLLEIVGMEVTCPQLLFIL